MCPCGRMFNTRPHAVACFKKHRQRYRDPVETSLASNPDFVDPCDVLPYRKGSIEERKAAEVNQRRLQAQEERHRLAQNVKIHHYEEMLSRDDDINVVFYGQDTIVTRTQYPNHLPIPVHKPLELYIAPSYFP